MDGVRAGRTTAPPAPCAGDTVIPAVNAATRIPVGPWNEVVYEEFEDVPGPGAPKGEGFLGQVRSAR
ncbi:hypothetical protein GCM10009663_60930 [Kitasatospora arboriphila]|uniref:Uncharacterized protein n=1 Tax=Kitasatospora arboriphila TaxID=258052 RepID=A0ABP4EM11_9ACTN